MNIAKIIQQHLFLFSIVIFQVTTINSMDLATTLTSDTSEAIDFGKAVQNLEKLITQINTYEKKVNGLTPGVLIKDGIIVNSNSPTIPLQHEMKATKKELCTIRTTLESSK